MTEDVSAEDALAIAQQALARAKDVDEETSERLDEATQEREQLREELTAVKLRLSEIDDERSYKSLTIDEKVGLVREHGFRKAAEGRGRAKLDYEDVMWEVFDGKPGNNTCYRIIRKAAGLNSDSKTGSNVAGFTARDPTDGNYHLAIDAQDAKRGESFSTGINETAEGVR